jgi:hypothetical protein
MDMAQVNLRHGNLFPYIGIDCKGLQSLLSLGGVKSLALCLCLENRGRSEIGF